MLFNTVDKMEVCYTVAAHCKNCWMHDTLNFYSGGLIHKYYKFYIIKLLYDSFHVKKKLRINNLYHYNV